jgi:hypothetical protein
MVVVVSSSSNGSRHVVREVERAVANDVVVVPFRIDPIEPTGAMAFFLASEHWLDAMTPPLEQHIAQLVSVAEVLLGTLSPRPGPAAAAVDGAPAAPGHPPAAAGPTPSAPGPAAAAPSTASRRRLVAATATVLCLAVFGLVGAFALASSRPAAPAPPPTASPSSLAVASASVAASSPGVEAPSSSPAASSASVAIRRSVAVLNLATGDCLLTPDEWATDASSQMRFWRDLPSGTWPETFVTVPCDEPHGAEAYLVGDHWGPDATFPGEGRVEEDWANDCMAGFIAYAGAPLDQLNVGLTGWTQDAEGWDLGLRTIACIAYDRDGGDLQGSLKTTSP